MSVLTRLLAPLRSAAAAFFKHDLAVRRDGPGVKLVIEERPRAAAADAAKPAKRVDPAERKEKEELAQIRAELAALLNQMPETRAAMRHLVFVEQALAKKGLRALQKVPLEVLQRALEQFEGLVTNWSPVGLANLRSKMAVAVMEREHQAHASGSDVVRYRTAGLAEPSRRSVPPELAPPASPEDDEALAAAYAALGALAPAAAGAPEASAVLVVPDLPELSAPPAAAPPPAPLAAGPAFPVLPDLPKLPVLPDLPGAPGRDEPEAEIRVSQLQP